MFTFASFFTLGLMVSFVFVIILLAAYFGGGIDMGMVIGLTVLFNFIMWLVSPFFMDLMFSWFYKCKKWTIDDLQKKSPRVAGTVNEICAKHKIKVPRLRFIEDNNPTAFCFGSGAFNARLAFSNGLFEYLEDDEIEAVIAHELGHIVRRDFIVMTIAQTLVQVLYEMAHMLMRKKGNDKNNLFYIGLMAYLLFWVSSYLLLYLSRTREYGADKFAADNIENPDSLSRALIKIAYGIIAKPESRESQRLMNSTRALGIYDNQSARNLGAAYESSKQDWNFISRVLLFDLVSPWAKIMELSSTHPLTGKRIDALGKLAIEKGKTSSVDMNMVRHESYDKHKLYSGFMAGAFIHFLPHILLVAVLATGAVTQNLILAGALPIALGIGYLVKTLYKYPNTQPQAATTFELMSDLYASPVRGRMVAIDGQIIGRGQAGSHFAEDVMLQDKTGLLYLNYESAFGFIGNFIFGIKKVRKLIGSHVKGSGWFFRGISHHLDLHDIHSDDGKSFKSRPAMWAIIGAVVMIVVGVAVMGNINSWV